MPCGLCICICYMQADIYAETKPMHSVLTWQVHCQTLCNRHNGIGMADCQHDQLPAKRASSLHERPCCSDQVWLRPKGPTPQSDMIDVCHVVFLHSLPNAYLQVAQRTAGTQLCQTLGGMQQLLHRGMGGVLAEVCRGSQLSHQPIHTFLGPLDQVCGQLHIR